MKRDPRAFLSDRISLDDYSKSRLIRSAVEREFTINDQLVWGVIQGNLTALLEQCTQLLSDLNGARRPASRLH
ncbi:MULTISPECIES: hypothetical protein [unclassified Synechococcus]|uniref:hypothetical protein n=1 Tax=unclassified Synechococcus TaxID=2626047 RepID=UPI000DB36C99|nr:MULTISPECIES: hypothetical protein [unclassified Synechococcus]MCT0213255.1 hypothetical protein [Synechococcus sp. CS-1326]MCT0231932.1 hypothetical protein [Synechococcus sp. CS-1327]PZV02711.1 MAG: hypothetical protein DCF23_11090 [Cyanobium sp.]